MTRTVTDERRFQQPIFLALSSLLLKHQKTNDVCKLNYQPRKQRPYITRTNVVTEYSQCYRRTCILRTDI